MLAMHALSSGRYRLVQEPHEAELIVLAGDFEQYPEVQRNPLLKRFPEKTFAYSEIDALVPYVPGVYCSAAVPRGLDLGRVESNIYFSRYASSRNPEIRQRASETKRWLFCFRGRRDCRIRAHLIECQWQRPDVQVLETAGYMHWKHGVVGGEQAQAEYADMLAQSHFALCPRGMGLGSIRLFEVMEMGIAPVLLADRYRLPPGPDWERFLITVPERRYRDLPRVLEGRVADSAELGRCARAAWEQHFAPPLVFDRVLDQIVSIRNHRRISERTYRRWWPVLGFQQRARKQIAEMRGR